MVGGSGRITKESRHRNSPKRANRWWSQTLQFYSVIWEKGRNESKIILGPV